MGESSVKDVPNLNYLYFGYPHLPHDDNTTELGDDATTVPHSTNLLHTFKDPLLM